MSWPFLNITKVIDKDGWAKAKGTLAKVTVGKTGIGEKITEIRAGLAKVNTDKFGLAMVSKNPKGDKDAVLAEFVKVEAVKPKVVELKKLATDAKTKHAGNLPSVAKDFLDTLVVACNDLPTKVEEKKKYEIDMYKQKGA